MSTVAVTQPNNGGEIFANYLPFSNGGKSENVDYLGGDWWKALCFRDSRQLGVSVILCMYCIIFFLNFFPNEMCMVIRCVDCNLRYFDFYVVTSDLHFIILLLRKIIFKNMNF